MFMQAVLQRCFLKLPYSPLSTLPVDSGVRDQLQPQRSRKKIVRHSLSIGRQQSGVTALHGVVEAWESLLQGTLHAESSHGSKSNYTNQWKMISPRAIRNQLQLQLWKSTRYVPVAAGESFLGMYHSQRAVSVCPSGHCPLTDTRLATAIFMQRASVSLNSRQVCVAAASGMHGSSHRTSLEGDWLPALLKTHVEMLAPVLMMYSTSRLASSPALPLPWCPTTWST